MMYCIITGRLMVLQCNDEFRALLQPVKKIVDQFANILRVRRLERVLDPANGLQRERLFLHAIRS